MNDIIEFQKARIAALEIENTRLNDIIKDFKKVALKATLSDPNFDRPLSELEVNFEIVESQINKK